MKKEHATDYRAFLLRLWRERESSPWRATVESPHTGERHGFANLELLFAFLEEQTGGQLKRKEQPKDINSSHHCR